MTCWGRQGQLEGKISVQNSLSKCIPTKLLKYLLPNNFAVLCCSSWFYKVLVWPFLVLPFCRSLKCPSDTIIRYLPSLTQKLRSTTYLCYSEHIGFSLLVVHVSDNKGVLAIAGAADDKVFGGKISQLPHPVWMDFTEHEVWHKPGMKGQVLEEHSLASAGLLKWSFKKSFYWCWEVEKVNRAIVVSKQQHGLLCRILRGKKQYYSI